MLRIILLLSPKFYSPELPYRGQFGTAYSVVLGDVNGSSAEREVCLTITCKLDGSRSVLRHAIGREEEFNKPAIIELA